MDVFRRIFDFVCITMFKLCNLSKLCMIVKAFGLNANEAKSRKKDYLTSNVYQNNLMPTIRICYFQSNKSFMKPYLCFSDLLCTLNYKIIVTATMIINTICPFKVSVTSYKATLMIFRDLEKLNFALSRDFCSVMIILSFGIL